MWLNKLSHIPSFWWNGKIWLQEIRWEEVSFVCELEMFNLVWMSVIGLKRIFQVFKLIRSDLSNLTFFDCQPNDGRNVAPLSFNKFQIKKVWVWKFPLFNGFWCVVCGYSLNSFVILTGKYYYFFLSLVLSQYTIFFITYILFYVWIILYFFPSSFSLSLSPQPSFPLPLSHTNSNTLSLTHTYTHTHFHSHSILFLLILSCRIENFTISNIWSRRTT